MKLVNREPLNLASMLVGLFDQIGWPKGHCNAQAKPASRVGGVLNFPARTIIHFYVMDTRRRAPEIVHRS